MAKTYMRTPEGTVFETEHPEYHPECEDLGGGEKGRTARREYCRAELKKLLKPGSTVYTVLRSVSKSGMSREISVYVIYKGALRNIDGFASDLTGYKRGNSGIKISGCGMDAGFALVYSLGAAIWPHGTARPHGTRNGEPDRSGGYALRHEWI